VSEQFDKDRPDQDLPDEQQLEEYLRGGSDVSRQYRQLHSAEVPAELDRLVMRQAQDAVKSRPAKSRTWMRWMGPLALAASAVLVVSIVIESGVQDDTYLTVPASAPAEVPAKQEVAEQDQATAGSARDSSVVHIMPVSPAALPRPAFEAPPAPISVEQPAAFQDQAVPPSEPAPAQFTSAEPLMKVEPPPPDLARRNRAEAVAQTSARTAAPAPAPVHVLIPPEVSMPEEDTSVEQIAVTGMRRHEQKQTAGPRNTIAAPAANSASDADEQEQERREYSDPEQWLRDIRELRKENKHEAADREWRRFRYVYPNYKVAENDAARGAPR
jgi:hypothetical protein